MTREENETKKKIVLEIISKGINESTMKELDSNVEMIPLTFDKVIKSIFCNNISIFKKFIRSVIHLNINEEDIEIEINNNEIPITHYKEYKKVIDFNIFINKDSNLNIEVNRDYYVNVKLRNNMYFDKLVSLSLVTGDSIKKLEDINNYQLNLNVKEKDSEIGEDIIVPYSIISNRVDYENKKTYIRYLDYYRKKYYNKEELNEDGLWLTLLTSENFYELYEILAKLVDNKTREKIIKDVVNMNINYVVFSEYEQQRGEELIEYMREKNYKKQQEELEKQQEELKKQQEELKKATSKKENEFIKTMLKNKKKYTYEDISELTGKNIDEIKKIEKSTN